MNLKTIVIADDEPKTRLGLKKTIENWAGDRFHIIAVENGEKALALAEQQSIDLLITDIRMPKMTGLKLIKAIRETGNRPAIIVISAYSEFDYAHEALQLGVIDYLLKPVKKNKLIDTLEKAFEIVDEQKKQGIYQKLVDDKLIDIHSPDREVQSSIQQAISFVNENLDKKISLKEVAEHIHLNASYFSVLFKEETGMNFSEYVMRNRLVRSKKLLLTTNTPVAEIAEMVGYQTSKYFIKIFKKYEGTTPSKYRKEVQ